MVKRALMQGLQRKEPEPFDGAANTTEAGSAIPVVEGLIRRYAYGDSYTPYAQMSEADIAQIGAQMFLQGLSGLSSPTARPPPTSSEAIAGMAEAFRQIGSRIGESLTPVIEQFASSMSALASADFLEAEERVAAFAARVSEGREVLRSSVNIIDDPSWLDPPEDHPFSGLESNIDNRILDVIREDVFVGLDRNNEAHVTCPVVVMHGVTTSSQAERYARWLNLRRMGSSP